MTASAKGATAQRQVQVMSDGTERPKGSAADPIYMANTGSRQLIGPWAQTNISASQASVQIGVGASGASQLDVGMARDGFLVGITATFTVAPAGSTLTVKVFKNGALLDATAVLSVTTGASLVRTATFVDGTAALGFVAGDKLGVAILTDGSWSATTSDVAVMLEVRT
jgi:hypothetical protein